jgi:hypothetical protein
VVITGVPAGDVLVFIDWIGLLGFREFYITEEGPVREPAVVTVPRPSEAACKTEPVIPEESPVREPAVITVPRPSEAARKTEPVIPEENLSSQSPQQIQDTFTHDGKWNIVSRNSMFVSFEFTNDGNYIAVEINDNSIRDEQIIHFGKYIIQDRDTVDLTGLGIMKIKSVDNDNINFTFVLSTDALKKETAYEAKKTASAAESAETDLFCKTWKLQRLDGKRVTGTEDELTILFSKAGTFLILYPDGKSELAQWKWKNAAENEFLYSYNNWKQYGSARINQSTGTALKFADPGYDASIDGYSAGNTDSIYELIPVNN